MYNYIKGIIEEIESSYIVVNNNDIGYLIYTSNPYSFNAGSEYKIYVYQNVREDEISLYGFKTKEERDLFLKLIDVKGLGPKMALGIIAGNTDDVISAIENGNIEYLKKFPKVGDKVARQIVLDLKGHLVVKEEVSVKNNDELISALEALGYKKADIKKIVPSVTSDKIEDQIKEALKLLLK